MIIKINYLGLCVIIDAVQEKITIVEDNTDSEEILDMVFKAILNKVNIDLNNYKVVYDC